MFHLVLIHLITCYAVSFLNYCFIYLFIIGCSVSLLLCGFFCRCDEQGLLSSCGAQVPHCSGLFFWTCRLQELWLPGSRAQAQ